MRLSDIKTILHAEVLWGEEHLDREVFSACGSDFMSDVLAFVKNQALLLTGLVNPQVVRTADMVEMKCIVFVRGKVPGPDILSLAEERDIVVMTCPKRMYEACGLLYSNFNLELMLNTIFYQGEGGMVMKLSDSWNVGILVFLVMLGILVALLNKAGGSAAFGEWTTKHIKTIPPKQYIGSTSKKRIWQKTRNISKRTIKRI